MKVIGLTGGIGTGKSTVSTYLKEKGCLILDADRMSRELTAPGGAALLDIREAFGDSVFFEDGTMNRKAVGEIVFNNSEKLAILENIITRKVAERTIEEVQSLREKDFSGIVVLDAPLLFECGMQQCADESWVVIADMDIRIHRIMQRDGLDRESIISRINNQMSDQEKIRIADYVINNSGSLETLYEQIDQLLERVLNEK